MSQNSLNSKRIIDQFHDNDLSLTELYNVQFEIELKDSNLEFSEDDTDFEQEENPTSEAVEDLLLDKIVCAMYII